MRGAGADRPLSDHGPVPPGPARHQGPPDPRRRRRGSLPRCGPTPTSSSSRTASLTVNASSRSSGRHRWYPLSSTSRPTVRLPATSESDFGGTRRARRRARSPHGPSVHRHLFDVDTTTDWHTAAWRKLVMNAVVGTITVLTARPTPFSSTAMPGRSPLRSPMRCNRSPLPTVPPWSPRLRAGHRPGGRCRR